MKLFMSVKPDYILDYKAVCWYMICRVRVGPEKFGQIRACSGWAVKIRTNSSDYPIHTYTQVVSLVRADRKKSDELGRDIAMPMISNNIDHIMFIIQSLMCQCQISWQ